MIVQPDFLDHWKTQLLIDTLSDPSAPLYVIRLWAHCQNRKTHGFPRVNPNMVKSICKAVNHDAEVFEKAMLEAGFIRIEAGNIIAHDWEVINASLIANWENGRRGGRPRNNNPEKTHGLTHKKPIANPGETDKIREDKIREEKRYKKEKGKKKAPAFKKPDFDEVREYFAELQHVEEAQTFFDHFTSNGWKVGGKAAMKCWKSAARNWCRRSGGGKTNLPTDQKPEITEADKYRDWVILSEYGFENKHGISHQDYADKIRADLADMQANEFGKKYKRRAETARNDLNNLNK